MLTHSLATNLQLQAIAGLAHSPDYGNLGNYLRIYLLSCKVEGKSLATLKHYHQRVSAYIFFAKGAKLPGDARGTTAQDIRLFIASLQAKGLEPSTISAHYRALKTYFTWIINEGFAETNPLDRIKPIKVPVKFPKPFSWQDIEKLIALTEGNRFLAIRNRAIILLALDTGLRLSEMAGIKIADLDFNRETIRVMGKGSKERVVRIGRKTQKAILRYFAMRDDEHDCLWVTEERRPLKLRGIQEAIKRLCHLAEINDATPGPHTFRHTAAITCLRNGMGEFTLQMMLGHSTLQMTRRYVSALNSDDVIEAHKKASPVDNMRL